MINSLAPGRCGCNFKCVIFEDTFKWLIEHSQCICLIWMPQDISDDNIVSSYGLVSSGNKSSPEPILFIKYDIIRTQWLMWNWKLNHNFIITISSEPAQLNLMFEIMIASDSC